MQNFTEKKIGIFSRAGILALLASLTLGLSACDLNNDDDDDDNNSDDVSAATNAPTVRAPTAAEVMDDWSPTARKVADEMITKYGQPQEVTESMLIWHNNGIWKRTIVFKEEIPHFFPMPHTDLLQQFIDYQAPLDRYDNLAVYDGSVIVERTKGEMSARCDKEEFNLLALNLAHDVAEGRRTVAEAREFYATTVMNFMAGIKDPYTQGLQFVRPQSETQDPDMEFGDRNLS